MLKLQIENNVGLALHAAVAAGKAILEIYERDDFSITEKDDKSPLTEADLAAHHIILDVLSNTTDTALPILSEESELSAYSERTNWKQFWLVDPLDGTKEFIKRNGEFTVNIALIEQGRPIAGVVYLPVFGTIYFGAEGLGAFRLDLNNVGGAQFNSYRDFVSQAISLNAQSTEDREFTVIGSRTHGSSEFDDFVAGLRVEHPNLEIISAGSSLKFCRIAEGVADVYPRMGRTMEWDTAAGHGVVNAAGKKVVVYGSDEELSYNKEELANPWFLVC